MKKVNKNNLPKNYENETVDITIECYKYLLENNYFENEEKKNLELLEKELINYSIFKLVDWKIDIDKLEIENWDDLSVILEVINNLIPTEEEKEAFFAQYIHCILYIYSKIKKEEPIKWTRKKERQNTLIYILEDGKIIEMITGEGFSIHIIPNDLITNLKSYYSQEKNPVLKK